MKLGPWLYILMIIIGIFSYYASEPLMKMMPQDKDGNIERQYSFLPVLMAIGGIALAFFGFIYAKLACETELKKRRKES